MDDKLWLGIKEIPSNHRILNIHPRYTWNNTTFHNNDISIMWICGSIVCDHDHMGRMYNNGKTCEFYRLPITHE